MYLTRNSKMLKSKSATVYNWGIPAFISETGLKTCPKAGICAAGCYAMSGTYMFKNTKNAYERRLSLSLSDQFENVMIEELTYILNKAKLPVYIRIHDSGDFYSKEYLEKWLRIMEVFPEIKFYAYTKEVKMLKSIKDSLPDNFTVIFSLGGKEDGLINVHNDRHSAVFKDLRVLVANGYEDASNDDLVALGPNKKIGLIYHQNKKYENSKWDKINIKGVTK